MLALKSRELDAYQCPSLFISNLILLVLDIWILILCFNKTRPIV